MTNIVIPKELPDLIDRFHFLWNKLRIIKNQRIDSDRHALLEKLRNIKAPSELEKRLIEQIEGEEKACLDNDDKLEKAYREEEASLYEKVRKACKDMLLGKYIKHITAWYTIYMRVDQVTMTGRTVSITGKSISFYREHNNFQWTCVQHYDLFDISHVIYGNATPTLESLETELQHFEIISREDLMNGLKAYKDNMVKECDHIIDYAEKMEDGPMPEDVPVDTSKME
jgi:hypothetical protein